MATNNGKAEGALRTISEVSEMSGLPQHILRYWETRFPQLRPLQRAGNRRYYRPQDIALINRINSLLNQEGYTIAGVQKLLNRRGSARAEQVLPVAVSPKPVFDANIIDELRVIRSDLATALRNS